MVRSHQHIRQLPCWQGDVSIEPLDGGITNHNYRVTDQQTGRVYVVRLGADIPVHHISRTRELHIAQAAHAAGLSPGIRYATDGVMVIEFVDGKTLAPEDVAQRSVLERIVPLLQICHHDVAGHLRGTPPLFWVFYLTGDYAATLKDSGSAHIERLPQLQQANDELQQAAAPFDIVFGHNDLLAANLIDDSQRLWLIDWEYAGFNTPLFDLGGLASNNGLQQEDEYWLLEAYFETTVSDELWRRYQAMKTASLLRETLWSMVSEIHSSLDFDYSVYTTENLQRFERSFAYFKTLT